MALGYLHESKILYRDLKPENILICDDGYIKLADFGLAKLCGEEIANSFCGTPEYLSPEMIIGTGHDQTLDWWALGVLIYEMLVGIPPFYNANKHKMYYLIEKGDIRWPEKDRHGVEVCAEARDLISKLLSKDKKKRLGCNNDVEEVLKHPWFAELDMKALQDKKIEPPFKPAVDSSADIQNFDDQFTGQEAKESILPAQSQSLIKEKAGEFEGF